MDCTETELTLTADDGVALAARRFDPVGEPLGSVVIHGAVATPPSAAPPVAKPTNSAPSAEDGLTPMVKMTAKPEMAQRVAAAARCDIGI